MLKAVSPLDGRYSKKTEKLQAYFSEYALIKYRIQVEVEYFVALYQLGLPQLKDLNQNDVLTMRKLYESFSVEDAQKVKDIEAVTNHDVKAVEYFIKEKLAGSSIEPKLEFIHFGLTSQDINNTAFPMMIRDGMSDAMMPVLDTIIIKLKELVSEYRGIPMLARTHGQPASPTTLGKEIDVYVERLMNQISILKSIRLKGKFGGATGNFNAHLITYPEIDWRVFGNKFLEDHLGLDRYQRTTQIAHYDDLSTLMDAMRRINVILIDLCRDIWTYISMEYFGQKVIAGEVGSSAMPHKVNPIDFENAEGNLGVANAIYDHLSNKLPISRLQRDLTDSTVLRNIGVPFGHTLIAYHSILKGLSKIVLRKDRLMADLDDNWAVVAEAIQNILRREGYPKPYEALKALTRGNEGINEVTIKAFINNLDAKESIKEELLQINPHNYVGYF
ncbi:MAG: adenylosuccinate lyase [Saprospiraceae bacterium]|nr:adenylosuccinate lyase [Saprospiraceae bacterium]